MKVNLIAWTRERESTSNEFSLEEALQFCAKMAGICYMEDSFDTISRESMEKTKRRLNQVLTSGHHSVFDHVKLTFEFESIPKILAMILNNEKDYSTSEKSARYTKFKELPGEQQALYFKWFEKLKPIIKENYPELFDEEKGDKSYARIEKLAQENARYFVSIFTPSTSMGYSVSLRQLNYIAYMIEGYIKNAEDTQFNKLLIPYLKDFVNLLSPYIVENLIPKGKNRVLSIFGKKDYFNSRDIWSYTYQTKHKYSFACFAQNQRHRSEHSTILIPNKFEFYVPEILTKKEDISEWLEDSKKVQNVFPQGMLIDVLQTGNLDTLLLKARERCCGQAQLEIMRHTQQDIDNFIQNSEYGNILYDETNGATAKCKYNSAFCSRKCFLGSQQFKRHI